MSVTPSSPSSSSSSLDSSLDSSLTTRDTTTTTTTHPSLKSSSKSSSCPQQEHPTQCHFYVKQKHRFCKRERAPNSLYCHTHTIHDDGQDTATTKKNTHISSSSSSSLTTTNSTTTIQQEQHSSQPMKRVPCPIDPSHSVYEYRLKKHLKICNKSLSQNRMMQQPYYCPSIHYNYLKNYHHYDHTNHSNLNNNTTTNNTNQNHDYTNNNNNINNNTTNNNNNTTTSISFTNIGDLFKHHSEYFKNLISKINYLYDHQLQINTLIEEHMNEDYNFIQSSTNDDEEFREKHHKQHCSIIYNIQHSQCLSHDFDYIEFGCGKGSLSYCVRRALIDMAILERRKELHKREDQMNSIEHSMKPMNTIENSVENSIENSMENSIMNSIEKNSSATYRMPEHSKQNAITPKVISNQTFILIDRENQRRKVDNFIKYGTRLHNNKNQPQDGITAEIVNVERILADIGDLDLSQVKCIDSHAGENVIKGMNMITTTTTTSSTTRTNNNNNNTTSTTTTTTSRDTTSTTNNNNTTSSETRDITTIFSESDNMMLTHTCCSQSIYRHTISISKHLCGIATDLTLCCLYSLNTTIPHKNKGIFIALCCHHKCTFDGYINKQFLHDCGINETDFKAMTLLTSFATCQFSKLSK
ncbi:hypothetical protein FDP41_003182 [Naegleria fowleri]|uniref:tRNA:m(4)X modification enzyme TRM13 n=1 Tax=Naegleria fowleri TaxID=5763 RepID=A0A6A5BVU6_NAEFO|nr:uncharacterized protein FDP41_003182 [Naegleria fowleri]KAF0977860.1 hypothetical protein FDP41_003182 [Naegleria fowleri]